MNLGDKTKLSVKNSLAHRIFQCAINVMFNYHIQVNIDFAAFLTTTKTHWNLLLINNYAALCNMQNIVL